MSIIAKHTNNNTIAIWKRDIYGIVYTPNAVVELLPHRIYFANTTACAV